MSDSDDQATKKEQKFKDDQSAGCIKMSNTRAQRLFYETQSTDSNQSTQTMQKIGETHNDQHVSNLRVNEPDRVDNKAAERSRLYRERHREEINRRRRDIRQRHKKIHQIHTVSNLQNIDEIEQGTSNNQLSSNSRTLRQQRYYERHKEEINKRKRDSRLKQNILQSIPATAAERNRNYRERNRQEINERRRHSRRRQQKLQRIHAECNIKIDAIEQITEATRNDQQSLNSSNDDIIQEKTHNFTSTPQQYNTQHFEETQNDRFQTTTAAPEDFDCSKRWAYVRDYYIRRKCKTGTNRTGSCGEAAKKRADLLSFLDGFTLTQRNRLPKDEDENTGDHSETMEYPEINIERTQSHYQAPTEMMYDEDETYTQDSNNSDDVANNTVGKEYCNFKREKKPKNINSNSFERKPVQNDLDETDLFFQSMAKILKKLPRYEQAHLRMQIGSLVGNAELRYISSNFSQNRDFSRRLSTSGFPVPSPSASDIPDVVPSPEAGSSAVNDQGKNIFHFSFKQEEI